MPGDRSRSPKRDAQHVDKILDGKAVARDVLRDVKTAALELKSRYGVAPTLVIIEVGDHHYGQLLHHLGKVGAAGAEVKRLKHTNYAELKARQAERNGFRSQLVRFSSSVDQARLEKCIADLNADASVHGILLELPFPPHLNENKLLQCVCETKDVDGMNWQNLGRLIARGGFLPDMEPKTRPAVPAACLEILSRNKVPLKGKHAVVVGRSATVGSPVAQMLMARDCTVTVCHAATEDLPKHVANADILVACAGRPGLIRGSWLKPGVVVVDVGMSTIEDDKLGAKIVGDVCFHEAIEVASKITPVPGGVGHVSFAILLRSALNLARQALSLTKLGIGPSGHEAFRCADKLVYPDIGLKLPIIRVPRRGTDLTKWCVVACDQYTSQPQYWKDVEDMVGDAPSTLNLIFPEVYLGSKENNQRIIRKIKDRMFEFDRDHILTPCHPGFVLIDRKTPLVPSRKGLLVSLDLELYSYEKGSQSLIRPTEKTIADRLPPRIAIREQSPLELPHILVLIDDPDKTVIEPLVEASDALEELYDFELMKNSGRLKGWHVADHQHIEGIVEALRKLASKERFMQRYGARPDQGVILFPVGDGNHSLATAKSCWEEHKRMGADVATHPARYALVELINVHDPGMNFEPIHRLVFNVEPKKALDEFVEHCKARGLGPIKVVEGASLQSLQQQSSTCHVVEYRHKGGRGVIVIEKPECVLEVASLTTWLDPYLAAHKGSEVDYVHGEEVIEEKIAQANSTLSFLLPIMDKNDLVKTVVREGVLPRKTFSMGAADEKRFYFECQRIIPEWTFYRSSFFRRGDVAVPLGQ